jgi:hypothetical protein
VPVDANEDPIETHVPGAACPCQPRLIQAAVSVFDMPTYSHNEPGHPGASDVEKEIMS